MYSWLYSRVVLTPIDYIGYLTFSSQRVYFVTLLYVVWYSLLSASEKMAANNPPPYAPGETKELLYPSVQDDPQQQQPLGVYPQQGSPAAPGMTSVTYYPPGPQQQQPQQLVISQPAPVVVQSQQQQRVPAFAWHVAASCCVVHCCCPLGFLAFILASKMYSLFRFHWRSKFRLAC